MIDGEGEQIDAGDQGEEAPETISRARELGWKSPDEWKGAPPKNGFQSAGDYVRRGEELLPVVRSQLDKERERSAKLERDIADERRSSAEKFQSLERMSKVALDTQRRQIQDRYETLKEAAVEVGDKEAYRRHDKAEKDALDDIDKRLEPTEEERKTAAKPPEMPAAIRETIDGWRKDNPWYVDNDPTDEMSTLANALHSKLLREKKGLTLAQNLDEVSKQIRKRFPEQFGEERAADEGEDNKPARRGSPVEGGSRMNGSGGGSKYSKLPADAKAQCDRFIKDDGLFLEKGETVEKNMAQARERYAKEYLGDQA